MQWLIRHWACRVGWGWLMDYLIWFNVVFYSERTYTTTPNHVETSPVKVILIQFTSCQDYELQCLFETPRLLLSTTLLWQRVVSHLVKTEICSLAAHWHHFLYHFSGSISAFKQRALTGKHVTLHTPAANTWQTIWLTYNYFLNNLSKETIMYFVYK